MVLMFIMVLMDMLVMMDRIRMGWMMGWSMMAMMDGWVIGMMLIWLVVSTPLKNITLQIALDWSIIIPIYGKLKKCSKPPTSYYDR